MNNELAIYSFISQFKYPKSYLGKIMLIAFLGTHIPLLTLFFYSVGATNLGWEVKFRILIIALIATLIGTAITLLTLQQLLLPINAVAKGLRKYLHNQKIPQLPTQYKDEVGVLMADTQYTIIKLDELIEQIQNYDSLTGLPNQQLFQLRLKQLIDESRKRGKTLAVIIINLDQVNNIKNLFGNDAGDEIIRDVAHKLEGCMTKNKILCRTNVSQFSIIYSHLVAVEKVEDFSRKILKILTEKWQVNNQDVYLGASLGIAIQPDNIDEIEYDSLQLVNQADVALNLAKEEGHSTYRFYSLEMNEKLKRRFQIERDLYYALEREELELFYQPQVDVITGNIQSAEALIRWKHHQEGFISPA